MTTQALTYETAHAAAWDAGNRHAHEHGRAQWNEDDWNEATRTMDELLGDKEATG